MLHKYSEARYFMCMAISSVDVAQFIMCHHYIPTVAMLLVYKLR